LLHLVPPDQPAAVLSPSAPAGEGARLRFVLDDFSSTLDRAQVLGFHCLFPQKRAGFACPFLLTEPAKGGFLLFAAQL
jgi:hypothetical protein